MDFVPPGENAVKYNKNKTFSQIACIFCPSGAAAQNVKLTLHLPLTEPDVNGGSRQREPIDGADKESRRRRWREPTEGADKEPTEGADRRMQLRELPADGRWGSGGEILCHRGGCQFFLLND